jgi:hypothetical protein
MRKLPICLAIFSVSLSLATLEAQIEKSPPEAAPVIAVLKAVKDSDVKAFKGAYSQRIREDKAQGDWEKNLKEAKANLKKLYGDYQLGDFTFTFRGDKEKGKVSFTHKKGKELELDVIKEAGEWKVDIR